MLTQLCLAVALLALHMESWLTVVPDLISNLTTPPEQAAVKLPCLLELLTVLPEEVENFKVGIMPRRRQAFREMLKAEPLNPDPNPDPDPNPNPNPNPSPYPNQARCSRPPGSRCCSCCCRCARSAESRTPL